MIAARPRSLAARSTSGPVLALLTGLLAAACGGGGTDPVVPPPPTCSVPSDVTLAGGWQLLAPAAWSGCATITVRATGLATDERLALVLLNSGGADGAAPSITSGGTSAFAAAGAAPLARLEPGAPLVLADAAGPVDRSDLEAGHALVTARREAAVRRWLSDESTAAAPRTARLAATVPATAAVGDPAPNGGFCTYSYTTDAITRKPATLRHVSAHALFFVADDRWSAFQTLLASRPDLFSSMADAFEGTVNAATNPTGAKRIYPALRENFGLESDLDGNGKVIIYFADLGKTAGNAFPVGYFDPTDVLTPSGDLTTGCTGSGANGMDMLYLLDPVTFRTYSNNRYSYDQLIDLEIPGTIAHELQHDVFINMRCLRSPRLATCTTAAINADLFLNEGLSMASEDVAGFGLNTASEKVRVGNYLATYQGYSLTTWPADGGDPDGHYGGAHAFIRWHLDQAAAGHAVQPTAAAFSKALVASGQLARPNLAAASGLSFEEGWARFTTAALFSGETFSPAPAWSYASGVSWSPLHTTVGYTAYTSLPRPLQATFTTSLKADGWAAFVTGVGQGGEATLRIDSTAAVKPQVVVMRFRGSLPR